ncbi:Caspase [Gryllus bimaculatus]|nr:Caspase [Gryllus bimaculatus]
MLSKKLKPYNIEKTVDASSDFYNMSHKNRGTAVIFNHKYFAVQNLDTRSGTKVDRDKLKKALKCLGFDVKVYNDLTYKAIIKVLKEVAEDDHSESDAFIMAVLTHGKPDGLYANDGPYPPDILWKSFTDEKCPTLSKKPKIFFIQACQGYKFDAGVTLQRTKVDNDILSPRIRVNTSVEYKFFSDPDFLIAFSTAPGYYSWRNTTSGSWFIRALCTELKKQGGKLHLLSLLTVVSRRVAIDYESYCPENPTFHNKKQIPCVFSMLTKLLIFPKKTNDTMACWNNNTNNDTATQENEVLIENSGDANSNYYNMSHRRRGTAVIFNHYYFSINGFKARVGTNVDRDKLKEALKHLGFDVKVYNDLTCNDLMQKVREEAEADHSESDAFVMAVLTHGQKDFLFANDRSYKYDFLWTNFTADKCPSLSNKPKLFFIEACQISTSDSEVVQQEPEGNDELLPSKRNINLSGDFNFFFQPDFLIAFSTVPGDYSFRNRKNGTWFIQALASKLKKHGRNLNLQSLLTEVSQHVAYGHISNFPDNPLLDKKKQIPCIFYTLTKLLIFSKKPKNQEHNLTTHCKCI